MNKPLKQVVNGHLEGIKLDEAQLDELEALMDVVGKERAPVISRFNWMSAASVAAFAMAFIVSTIYFENPTDIPLLIRF